MKKNQVPLTIAYALLLTTAVGLTPLFSGCAFTQKVGRQVFGDSPGAVQANLSDVVAIGTQIALQQNPAAKPKFELALASLERVIADSTVTGGTIVGILQNLPVTELKDDKAALYFAAGALLMNRFAGTTLDLKKNEYVEAAALGIRDGLKRGLGELVTE